MTGLLKVWRLFFFPGKFLYDDYCSYDAYFFGHGENWPKTVTSIRTHFQLHKSHCYRIPLNNYSTTSLNTHSSVWNLSFLHLSIRVQSIIIWLIKGSMTLIWRSLLHLLKMHLEFLNSWPSSFSQISLSYNACSFLISGIFNWMSFILTFRQ